MSAADSADDSRPALDVLLEAVAVRDRQVGASLAPSEQMVSAVARLHSDVDLSAIALDAVAAIAPRMVRDAQVATKAISEGVWKKAIGFVVAAELTNLAAIFARTAHEDVYDSVCMTLRGLNVVMCGGAQGV